MVGGLIRWFYPVPQASEDERECAGLLISLSLGGVLVSGCVFLMRAVLGAPQPQLLANFMGVLFALVTLGSLRAWRSIALSTHLVAGTMCVTQATVALVLNDPTLLAWMVFVPVLVLLLTDAWKALGWFVFSASLSGAVSAWLLKNVPVLVQHTPPELAVFGLTYATCTLGMTGLFAATRARAMKRLAAAHLEATRANELKSQFLASFSHEIRTPLNGVLGTTDLLLAGPLSTEVRDQLLVIQRSGSSLLRTINDVLELSRIEAGRLDLFPVATDLPRLLREVVELFRARAQSQRLELALELEPGHPCAVTVDDLRLRQVLQNLVGNAVKFTTDGGVRVRLAAAEPRGERVRVRITVDDTGPGIPAEARERLFVAFHQARAQSDRKEGSGLGLAISKQFVELMGGRLWVESTPGEGSRFGVELELPRAEAPAAAAQAAPAGRDAVQHLRVLVVDDNEINLRVAVSLLKKLGHEVHVARDGEEGLAAIAEHQPDVVFMDCHMPGLDGLEATRRLRAAGDGRPVVALTASVYAEDRARCEAAGMNFFVSKPVTLAALRAALVEVAGAIEPHESPAQDKRALVVDDDPHVRRMTVRLLRAEGFEVADAADLEAAQILYDRARPGYLVIDNVLGGSEDGLHFAARLCREHRGLRVVVTSGQPPTHEQLAALHAAGGQFLAKPYSRKGLMERMRVARG